MDHSASYKPMAFGIFRSHLCLISCLLIAHIAQAIPAQNTTDVQALLSFKHHISGDPLGALSSWNETNTTLHFCNWPGVTCGGREHPDRVTALSLGSSNLTGTLSPNLGNLTFLRTLVLSRNYLSGAIPRDLGRLSRLQALDLSSNSLEGEIPPSLTHCSRLRYISLGSNSIAGQIPSNFSRCLDLDAIYFYYNQLTGTIPPSLGSLPRLHTLGVHRNQLTGNIPPSICNASSLGNLDLAENKLNGHIPDTLGRLWNLKFLGLELNALSGEIPASLFNLSSLYYFNVAYNNLTGAIPPDMGNTLPSLQSFQVFFNQLGGLVPQSLSNASSLRKIILQGNHFVGAVPENLGSLRNLSVLNIALNQLEAEEDFFTSLSNCSNLLIIALSGNNLGQVRLSSLANLSTQLSYLVMSDNQVSGSIPAEIGKLNKLALIDMSHNRLSGTIPSTIGALQNLNYVSLDANQLHGEIPTSVSNLTQLNTLSFAWNELQGNIPSGIGNLLHLGSLDVSYNKLNGTIPGQAIGKLTSLSTYLGLSNNLLTGSLPLQIASLINLEKIDVSENRLSGEIPGSLGGCQLLGQLFMQGNLFEGNIPPALSALKGIQVMDLSRNNLSGPIPEFFRRSNLLRYLNLSFNNLEGQVPKEGVYGNASAISVVGNNNLCGGIQELHLQPCYSFQAGKNARRSSPMKIIVPVVATLILLVLLGCLAYYIRQRRTKANPVSPPQHEPFTQVSYADIHKATDGFSSSNLVGAGSFGSVYRGTMDCDPTRVVAIKVLNLDQRGADRSFLAECDSLRVIRHRNLVNIVTVCSSIDRNGDGFKALIFEYMENGSLDEWLHPRADAMNANPKRLSLVHRLSIVMDVALALDYLHNQCQTPIVHRDLKPGNVLLDRDMTAHVGDFGLSRFLDTTTSSSQDTTMTSGVKGSIGYIAPEYGMGGAVSTDGDVYSYGVLLLEIFTGMRPTDNLLPSDVNLRKYVEMAYPDHVLSIVDPHIVLETDENAGSTVSCNTNGFRDLMQGCMISVLKIGLLCSKEFPTDRMKMGDVIKELLYVKKMLEEGSYAEC